MCNSGHIGHRGWMGDRNAPKWQMKIIELRNKLYDAMCDGIPNGKGIYPEDIIDTEFKEIDSLITKIEEKLQKLNS